MQRVSAEGITRSIRIIERAAEGAGLVAAEQRLLLLVGLVNLAILEKEQLGSTGYLHSGTASDESKHYSRFPGGERKENEDRVCPSSTTRSRLDHRN